MLFQVLQKVGPKIESDLQKNYWGKHLRGIKGRSRQESDTVKEEWEGTGLDREHQPGCLPGSCMNSTSNTRHVQPLTSPGPPLGALLSWVFQAAPAGTLDHFSSFLSQNKQIHKQKQKQTKTLLKP